jgi:SPP1 family predicted phage head-tail adaptor
MQTAGPLNERVTVQTPTTVRNALGESTIGWGTVGTVWASVNGLSSREVMMGMQANALVTYKIRIRFFTGITHQHRLLWRGRTMEIASVVERDNRTMHEILAREVE